MKEKVLSATLVLSLVAGSVGTAFAENPKAEEYRKIFSTGTYTVEYDLNGYVKKTLEVSGGQRMDYTTMPSFNNAGSMAAAAALSMINPVLGIAGMFAGKTAKKEPSTLYKDGKYYQFLGKKKARVATQQQLGDENLDPNEGWSSVQYKLALPEAFTVFAPNDEFNRFTNYSAPVFVESGTYEEKNEQMPFDKYVSRITSASGNVLAEKFFYMYYGKNGDLNKVETKLKMQGGEEIKTDEIKVRKITGELPENALKIPEGCKVYAAGTGDMDDLLDRDVLVEDYSSKGKE